MKLLSSLTIALLATTTLSFAETTMCFKENHNSMATIESTKLDGGECKGNYTLKEMKTKGWNVEDIKISTKNDKYSFVYILKTETSNTSTFNNFNSNLSSEELELKIMKRIEVKKIQEEKEKEIERKILAKENGARIYTQKCSSCHGINGEKRAYNVAKPINSMSLEDLKYTISRYTNDFDYGNGQQMIMRPYASNTTEDEVEFIYEYLQSLNK